MEEKLFTYNGRKSDSADAALMTAEAREAGVAEGGHVAGLGAERRGLVVFVGAGPHAGVGSSVLCSDGGGWRSGPTRHPVTVRCDPGPE